jgi:hypothetical protein
MQRAECEAGWSGWGIRDRCSGDPLEDQLGQPGLWHVERGTLASTSDGFSLFIYPDIDRLASLVGGAAWALDPHQLTVEMRDWARATSRGKLPPTWDPPSPQEVASWLTLDRLTVRSGPHLSKGQLECDAKALRIVFPELVRLRDALPETRRAWLRELCFDAQSRWHMVRFGLRDRRVRAEVDLSGVPAAIAQPLFTVALEALLFSVSWVLPSLALVNDPSATTPVLDRGPWWRSEKAFLASPRGPRSSPESTGSRAPTAHLPPGGAHRQRSDTDAGPDQPTG